MPGSSKEETTTTDTHNGSQLGSKSERGSRNSYPQPTAPNPGPALQNINDAGGPVQSTNLNLPAPGTLPKDIPLESGRADGGKEENAIGRLDTDHDSDDSAATARKRATRFKPTGPSDALNKPGREL